MFSLRNKKKIILNYPQYSLLSGALNQILPWISDYSLGLNGKSYVRPDLKDTSVKQSLVFKKKKTKTKLKLNNKGI